MASPFKPFEQMTPEHYASIGLKCGLEVHQQLLTRRKLFCRCPAGRYGNDYDAVILRHMRPTLSELGEYDGTALMEKKTQKNIYYRIHRDTVCTYEMDDTPPFFMDEEALDTALEVALLLRLNLVSELHVARKQYLDGSIPTGFQRTTILGVDGWIPYGDRRIGIRQLGLEEDSCREVSDIGHDRTYITDRLGMPLIETVTEPEMYTPQQAAEVCDIIRKLSRSTGRVRTGYGAGRQDVNVSVRGGTRIEIKGVPQISRIPRLIYNEAMRQWSLLRIRDELHARDVTADTLRHERADVTRIVADTDYAPMRAALNEGQCVKCIKLEHFAGLLREPTQEHTAFAREFSDRIRVIACLTWLPNMVHSDIASETLPSKFWKDLRRRMRADRQDALVLVWGGERDTETACDEIAIRAREATEGVPPDTRQALKDGTNGFERVLPGAERMYPDTDLPPLEIGDDRRRRVQARMPRRFWDRETEYRDTRLPEDVIGILSISPRVNLYDRLVDELGADPVFAAVVFVQRFKAWRRAGRDPNRLDDESVLAVFRAHSEGRIAREGVPIVIEHLFAADDAEGSPEDRVAEAIAALGFEPATNAEIDVRIADVVDRVSAGRFREPRTRYNHMMGILMSEFLGRADGTEVAGKLAAALGIERHLKAEKVRS